MGNSYYPDSKRPGNYIQPGRGYQISFYTNICGGISLFPELEAGKEEKTMNVPLND